MKLCKLFEKESNLESSNSFNMIINSSPPAKGVSLSKKRSEVTINGLTINTHDLYGRTSSYWFEFLLSEGATKEQFASVICMLANNYCMDISDTGLWNLVSEKFQISENDFYNDSEETRLRYGNDAVDLYGIVNWKYKG